MIIQLFCSAHLKRGGALSRKVRRKKPLQPFQNENKLKFFFFKNISTHFTRRCAKMNSGRWILTNDTRNLLKNIFDLWIWTSF